jgi:hypothetical protein
MNPEQKQPRTLPFQEPAYGYFEGMEERTMRRIREASTEKLSNRNWFRISVAGTVMAAAVTLWFFLPKNQAITIDQVHESELVQYLSVHADIQELAASDPQIIPASVVPSTIPTPAEGELDEWIDASTFDQIQEL